MKKKQPDGMFIELDGEVNILTRKNGKEKREVLDGETVLRSVVYVLESALENFKRNPPTKAELKKFKNPSKITRYAGRPL